MYNITSSEMEFKNYRKYSYMLAGRPLVIETGKMAGLANGSCLCRYGDTAVLCCATASEKPRDGIDFLPLSVDFDERMYAAGKIPGGYLKREGRPSEKAILTSRVIDRPIRPLFPKDLRNDIALSLIVMSVDLDCSPEITAMIGASVALSISDIPWNGPIAGVFMGLVDGELVVNPTEAQRKVSDLELTVAASMNKVVMIEAGAREVDDDTMYQAIMAAHEEIKGVLGFINGIVAEIGKPKFSYPSGELDHDMFDKVFAFCEQDVMAALDTDDKNVRDARMVPVKDAILEKFSGEYPDLPAQMEELIYKIQKKIVRRWLLVDKKRVDGRAMNQIRPLAAEVGVLPRVHGSGLFTRGQTQVLTAATLGTLSEAQMLDGIDNDTTKRYMHHYNMPGFSTGEAKAARSPGRREIGHGALAERALLPVIPSEEEFPYALRLVSEILSSNGSSSMASVCGSTLSLMDAGVPIKAPVAGVAMGLIKDAESGNVAVLTDIQGLEDFLGDMDFKVAGTVKGITAIQMDIKIAGIDRTILERALKQAYDGRLHILKIMLETLAQPREHLSKYAPKIVRFTINPEKIREVIGPGGKMINKIIAETGVKIDIEDDGRVYIATPDEAAAAKARRIIEGIAKDIEVGDVYLGKVVRIMNFGAFIELTPGKDGMLHISKMADHRVEKVEDVMNIGDEIEVKVSEIDSQGRVNLIRNDITYPAASEGGSRSGNGGRGNRPPRRDGRPFGGGNDRT